MRPVDLKIKYASRTCLFETRNTDHPREQSNASFFASKDLRDVCEFAQSRIGKVCLVMRWVPRTARLDCRDRKLRYPGLRQHLCSQCFAGGYFAVPTAYFRPMFRQQVDSTQQHLGFWPTRYAQVPRRTTLQRRGNFLDPCCFFLRRTALPHR